MNSHPNISAKLFFLFIYFDRKLLFFPTSTGQGKILQNSIVEYTKERKWMERWQTEQRKTKDNNDDEKENFIYSIQVLIWNLLNLKFVTVNKVDWNRQKLKQNIFFSVCDDARKWDKGRQKKLCHLWAEDVIKSFFIVCLLSLVIDVEWKSLLFIYSEYQAMSLLLPMNGLFMVCAATFLFCGTAGNPIRSIQCC